MVSFYSKLDGSIFYKEKLFFWIGLIGLILAVAFWVLIFHAIKPPLEVCFLPSCIDNFLDWFSFPIKILATTVALMSIVGLIHTSRKTNQQIEKSQKQIDISEQQTNELIKQNSYNNYFNHLNYFSDQLKNLELKAIKINNPIKLYKVIFKENTPNNFNHIGDLNYLYSLFFGYIYMVNNTIYDDDQFLKNVFCKGDYLGVSKNSLNEIEYQQVHRAIMMCDYNYFPTDFLFSIGCEFIKPKDEIKLNVEIDISWFSDREDIKLIFDDLRSLYIKLIEISFNFDNEKKHGRLMTELYTCYGYIRHFDGFLRKHSQSEQNDEVVANLDTP